MTESKICTCPSGDGSLRWPCPKHPAVEQAGGDERAAFNRWIAEQQLCQGSDISLFTLERNGALVSLHELLRDAYQAGQARAALAQPSPAQAEAERPEVVAYRTIGRHEKHQHPHYALNYYKQNAEDQAAHWRERGCEVSEDELMTVAQHDRIFGALRAKADQLREALEWRKENQAGQRELLRSVKAERDAALARVAEMERQEPVVRAYGVLPPFAEKVLAKLRRFYDCAEDFESGGVDIGRHWLDLLTQLGLLNRVQRSPALWEISQQGEDLLEAPVAQAQQLNDLDKQCRDDVARALGLRPNQERGFAWSYLLASIKSCVKTSGDSAQAQHSVPETTNEEANSFLRVADAGQFKDNAAAVRTAAMIIRGLLHRPAIMKSIIRHRIGLTPEYEGQWHADMYGEDGEVQHHAEADTPDEAVRAVVALAAAPGKEGCDE